MSLSDVSFSMISSVDPESVSLFISEKVQDAVIVQDKESFNPEEVFLFCRSRNVWIGISGVFLILVSSIKEHPDTRNIVVQMVIIFFMYK